MQYVSRVSKLEDGLLELCIELCSKAVIAVPKLPDVIEDFVRQLKSDKGIKGAIIDLNAISSDEASSYRDLLQLLACNEDDAESLSLNLGRLSTQLRSLEKCGKPVVALLHNGARGLALEIALACHYRIAVDCAGAGFGLNQIHLGLIPGAGGTQRLLRLVGIAPCVDLLLEGKEIQATEALKLGIIDEFTGPQELAATAQRWFAGDPEPLQPWDRKGFRVPGGTGQQTPELIQLFMGLHGKLQANTQDNYPAPRALVSAIYEGSTLPIEAALRVEVRFLTELVISPVASNMVRTLKVGKVEADDLLRRPDGHAQRHFQRVGIVGAGMMGAGIAYSTAAAGIDVVLLDRTTELAEKGKGYSRSVVARHVSRSKMSEADAENLLNRIAPTSDFADLADCDLVIESVYEQIDVKADVTQKVEAVIAADALYATNTSTLKISKLAEASARPQQFVGLHFSSPVDRMPIIEIILGEKTSEKTLAHSLDFSCAIRKTPIVVNDQWGFYLSRVFGTYPEHGALLLSKGVSPALIENASRQAGMPVGPLAVIDEVSLDLSKNIQDSLEAVAGDEFVPSKARAIMNLFVNDLGRLGRKSGGGLYEYPEGGEKYLWPGLADHFPLLEEQPDVEDIQKSLLYRQALEAVRCLQDKVITSPADADVCAVVGWNFPACTGGPLSLIDTVGLSEFIADCKRFAEVYGDQFSPPQLLIEMDREAMQFYPSLQWNTAR